jgi:hypothetical protein
MAVVFIYGFSHEILGNPLTDYPKFKIDTFPLFFGSAAFLFAIPQLVFPIHNAMKEPQKFNQVISNSILFFHCSNPKP